MNTNITMENLSQFEQAFDQNPVNAVAMNAVTANGINHITDYTTRLYAMSILSKLCDFAE